MNPTIPTSFVSRNPITRLIAAGLACGVLAGTAHAQLLHYDFDEADSGDLPAIDQGSGLPATGTFEGGATRTGNTPAGFSLGALDASGAGQYVTSADPEKLDGLGTLTLTAWVNLQGAPAHGNRIMSKQLASGNFDGFSFAFNNPGSGDIAADNFGLNLALGGSGGFTFSQSGGNLSADNEWLFVAVTYDGTQTSDNVIFYSGDVAEPVSLFSTLSSDVGALVPNDVDFRVAAQSEGTTSAPVWLDDIRVYGSVLDATQLDDVRLANVPEPSAYALLTGGLFLGLVLVRRIRSAKW